MSYSIPNNYLKESFQSLPSLTRIYSRDLQENRNDQMWDKYLINTPYLVIIPTGIRTMGFTPVYRGYQAGGVRLMIRYFDLAKNALCSFFTVQYSKFLGSSAHKRNAAYRAYPKAKVHAIVSPSPCLIPHPWAHLNDPFEHIVKSFFTTLLLRGSHATLVVVVGECLSGIHAFQG